MTPTQARLAHFTAVSRERELTDAEQREVLRLAEQERQTEGYRLRYWRDPEFRQRERECKREGFRMKLSDPAFREARNAKRRAARA